MRMTEPPEFRYTMSCCTVISLYRRPSYYYEVKMFTMLYFAAVTIQIAVIPVRDFTFECKTMCTVHCCYLHDDKCRRQRLYNIALNILILRSLTMMAQTFSQGIYFVITTGFYRSECSFLYGLINLNGLNSATISRLLLTPQGILTRSPIIKRLGQDSYNSVSFPSEERIFKFHPLLTDEEGI